ncbi:hypothetical protein ATL39_3122 [Sinobaca qinghaiensis]|uniref:Ribosomal L7/L12-like protein n=1 Tax=Sinobaca qinghaiensis TaxID=342944 RepID=A0A419UX28_9BACL|nr:hypothetical protein [Sinobaca qinghaiensis]RKD69695.1 hypothetical protein ATL39_3122 [Sinobaca qinghaiensis]
MGNFIMGVLFLVVTYLLTRINRLEKRIKQMQIVLDRGDETPENSEALLENELRKLIEEGNDVKAVKMAREKWGLSLIEGKQYIDKLK